MIVGGVGVAWGNDDPVRSVTTGPVVTAGKKVRRTSNNPPCRRSVIGLAGRPDSQLATELKTCPIAVVIR